MYANRAHETACILLRDLGLVAAIRYAERVAAYRGPKAGQYRDAASILKALPH